MQRQSNLLTAPIMTRRVLLQLTCVFSAFALLMIGLSSPAQSVQRKEVPPTNSLTFVSFNVCLVNCQLPAPSWDIRRARVAKVINESGGSIIGLQEATNIAVPQAKTQWQDIQNLTTPAGYTAVTVTTAADDCAWRKHLHCVNGPHILYKPSEVQQTTTPNGSPNAGITMLKAINPNLDDTSGRRAVSWAYFKAPATGPFLVVSMHLPTEKDPLREQARVAVATNMGAWVDAMNITHGFPITTPTVLLADLNSYDARQPIGAQRILTNTGWSDAFTSLSRRNIQYPTINHQPQNENPWHGFPPQPYRYRSGIATRIDYIMLRGPVVAVDYETMLWLNTNYAFNPDYQASDHQPIRAVIVLPPA